MKRDMDLIRQILLELEEAPYTGGWANLEIEKGLDDDVYAYHVQLLHEAGLIEAQDLSTLDGVAWKPKRLTWEGHEFLEAARESSRWEKAKDVMQKEGGGLVLSVLKEVLLTMMRGDVLGA